MLRDYTISEEKPELKEKKINKIENDSTKILTWDISTPSHFKHSFEELAHLIYKSIDIKFN